MVKVPVPNIMGCQLVPSSVSSAVAGLFLGIVLGLAVYYVARRRIASRAPHQLADRQVVHDRPASQQRSHGQSARKQPTHGQRARQQPASTQSFRERIAQELEEDNADRVARMQRASSAPL